MPDNINPNANSKESARKPGDITSHSINEPGKGAPKAFKVPEDHTLTTAETLKQDYPDGYVVEYVAPTVTVSVAPKPTDKTTLKLAKAGKSDPDDLEDEIDQAERNGDFKSMHRSPPSKKK